MLYFQIAILFFTLLVLPVYMFRSFWKSRYDSRFQWLLRFVYVGSFLLFFLLVGRWDWVSYYLRYLLIFAFLAVAFISFRRVRGLPFFLPEDRQWKTNADRYFELLIGFAVLFWALRGLFVSEQPVRLSFPLRGGAYYVGQGGNSVVINYHNPSRSQQYALDIVQLNSYGLRAAGIYPNDVQQYTIYGETIYSPCDGRVIQAVDGLPDHIPPATDTEHPAGNHVGITCEGVNVVLAHMQNGSLLVEQGNTVTSGQPLGKVGNSGNTSEPHLHVHAIQAGTSDLLSGKGVPILMDGRFLARNDTVTRD